MSVAQATGLLLAMMEPPSSMEEEFQDWYDTEHFPERAGTKGFLTAQRLLCLEGWPRYLALYDLSALSVLDGPGYAEIARNRYSQWTRRIIPRMWGHYRSEAEQVYPGTALLGAAGRASRVALWRFRDVAATETDCVTAGMRTTLADTPGLLQLRVFRARSEGPADCFAVAELAGVTAAPVLGPSAFKGTLRYLDMTNVYTPYWR
jgi:hypothetical protein